MPATQNFENTGWESGSWSRRNLVDLCTDAFLLIFHIKGGNDPGHLDDLRKNIALLLADLDKQGTRGGLPEEDLKATRYALCALIDETILNSRWEFKDQWADRSLQLEYFGEHVAGERFFDLLARVRQKGRSKVDLLEVFCITLILGFQGKYKARGQEDLPNLIRAIAGEVNSYRGGGPTGLSPHWRIPDEATQRRGAPIPYWAWMTPLVLILSAIAMFVVFKFWLSSAAEPVLRMS
jgi:type VI secretion system protein ImpK